MAKIEGLPDLDAKIGRIKADAVATMVRAIAKGAAEFTDAAKAAAPVGDEDPHPGRTRDSVHKVDGDSPLKVRVVADAKDDKGREYPGHAEHGHRLPDGTHVAARPWFYPAWRLSKKRIMGRIRRAISRAVRLQGVSDG